MKTRRCFAALAFLIPLAAAISAPTPAKTKAGEVAAKPVSFTATPIHFPVDGKEHHPNITVSPADATYKIDGQFSEKAVGIYTFTIKATGKYAGMMTCKWRIDAPAKAPKHPVNPKTAEMVKKLQGASGQ